MRTDQKVGDPDEAASLIELYYEKGWTDGLPVVPPSRSSVDAMLQSARLESSEVVGEIPLRNVRITADKVAINAVMAGCLPSYMPVVVSAVKGLCSEEFGYHGFATSTGGASVVVIVNGPVSSALGINARNNAFGPGVRPNLTIGRALRLLMMNAINTRPDTLDASTLGSPGKIAFCFAENEAASPWEPLHVERGFAADLSTTTLFACESVIQVYNQLSNQPEPFLMGMADAMSNMGSMNIVGQPQMVVVFAGEHTEVLRKSGWSKGAVKEFLFSQAKRSVADLKRVGRLPGQPVLGDDTTFRHPVLSPEDIVVVCAGGHAGSFSAVLTGWGGSGLRATRTVTTQIMVP
jgi:hypothetical protein